jgi:hypothetical protein
MVEACAQSGQLNDPSNGASLDAARLSGHGLVRLPPTLSADLTMPAAGGALTTTIPGQPRGHCNIWSKRLAAYRLCFRRFIGDRYLIFSTNTGDGNLYARVNNTGSEQSVNLGAIPNGSHRYRIEWQALDANNDRVNFYIDGSFKTQLTVSSSGLSNLYNYFSNNGTSDLNVDFAQVTPPYQIAGTYTSCALDGGLGNTWDSILWDATLDAATSLVVESPSSNGSTWSSWSQSLSAAVQFLIKPLYAI